MIEAQGLTRRYGDFVAVNDVSFAIQPGEVVGLLGHNGAGKTTIMKMLTGFIEPSAGQVTIDGVAVQSDALQVQANIGYLPESLPLYPELTVVDYLAHAAGLRGLAAQHSVPAAIAATQLEDKALDRIDTLSRGYRQRLGVAQAILHEPKFLILDEPSNGLDPNQIQQMRRLIRNLSAQATVILSTHIMQEVSAVCDHVLILRGGELVVDEPLSALRASSQAKLTTNSEAPVAQLLADVTGVTEVLPMEAGQWLLNLQGEPDPTVAAIASALVRGGVSIYHLAPQVRDLESVFAEVNESASSAVGVGDAN